MEALKTKIASLEKAVNSPLTPADFKPKMKTQIESLKKQLEEKLAEAAAKEDIKKEKAPVAPKKEAPKKETPKAPVKKEAPKTVKKTPPPAPKTVKKTKAAPAKVEEPSCEDLLDKYNAAKANRAKSAKKSAKVSVSEKVGDSIASAVSKAIHNIPLSDIKEKPKQYIAKFERAEHYVTEFSKGLKTILGDDFDKDEIMKPFEEIVGKFIAEIKKKYL